MERIVDYLNEELDRMGSGRPEELDSLKRGGFASWADAGTALVSFSGMLAILWEMAEERRGGARTMGEVAGRYSTFAAERMEETLGSKRIADVFREVAKAYLAVKTYGELARITEAHARWVERLRQWVFGELPWEKVSACVDEAWSAKKALEVAKAVKRTKDAKDKAGKKAAKGAKLAKIAVKAKLAKKAGKAIKAKKAKKDKQPKKGKKK